MEITIVGTLKAKPDCIQQVVELMDTHITASREEQACLQFEMFQSHKDPTHFNVFERWTDKAGLDLHFKTPHTQATMAGFKELLAVPGDIQFLTKII
jgi:quinol monooxygenase YgiN